MPDPYSDLASALSSEGIRCQFQAEGQMVVSHQVGSIWPDRGNSFWVTHVAGRWYLFTWSPVGYRVPDSADFVAVCRALMAFGHGAMYRVPSEIAEPLGLVELSQDEAEAVSEAMGDGA
jgi:hypothetical protein